MDYRLVTRGFAASDSVKEYLDKKLSRLEKVIPEGDHVHMDSKIEKERGNFTVEFTLHIRGRVIRVEEVTNDLFASVDISVDALEKKLQKYKTRRMVRHKSGSKGVAEDIAEKMPVTSFDSEVKEDIAEIVRTKRFFLSPMSLEEARLQLEMVGHTFFVFKNEESDEINLIYKRKNGTIGLIEFEI